MSRSPFAWAAAVLAALLLALEGARARAGSGTFESGRFHFGVAYDATVAPQDLPAVAAAFEQASELLRALTDGHHAFGNVMVCKGGASETAEFLLTRRFHTRATAGHYGKLGHRVVLDLDELLLPGIGPYLIVHEFAHHAYGLFDESIGPAPGTPGPFDPSHPPFASKKPKDQWNWSQTVCVDDFLAGAPGTSPSKPPQHSCLVPLESGSAGQTVCIMEHFHCALQHGAAGFMFCRDSHHEQLGNPGATWQEFIHGESCFATIEKSGYSLAFAPGSGGFHWVELGQFRRFVLVLDKSGSMGSEPMKLAILGAKNFVNPMTSDDEVGVVAFDSTAALLYPLTSMTASAQQAAKSAIGTLVSGGGTDISAGLEVALQMQLAATGATCARAVVLLSDGQSSVSTALLQQYADAEIPVCAIGIGSGVDEELMQQIATATKGVFLHVGDVAELPSLFSKHAAWLKQEGVFKDFQGVLKAEATTELDAVVEDSATQVTFAASWDEDDSEPGQQDDIAMWLETPEGDVINDATGLPDGVKYSQDGASASYIVKGAALEPGQWKVALANAAEARRFNLVGIARSDSVLLAADSDKLSYAYPESMHLSAVVHSGAPIRGANVVASVVRPDGSHALLDLADDGAPAHGDELAGDGIYSGRFAAWNLPGAYTVRVTATGGNKAARTGFESFGLKLPKEEQLEPFKRSVEFGVLATGVPAVDPHQLLVRRVDVAQGSFLQAQNKLLIRGLVDLDPWSVTPQLDKLTIRVGGAAYDIDPLQGELLQLGTKPRFVFDFGLLGPVGYVDLFKKGTSLGRFQLRDEAMFMNEVGALDAIACGFRWGKLDDTVTVQPSILVAGTEASFSDSSKILTELFFVTSARVEIHTGETGADRLSLRAKIGGYQPHQDAAVLAVGPLSLAVGPSDWVKGQSGTFGLSAAVAGGSLQLKYDPEHSRLLVKGKQLDLTGFVNPLRLRLTGSGFDRSQEIHMAQKGSPKKDTYSY